MSSPAYLENRTCKTCGRFDILCDCKPMKPCPTCSHSHLRENGTYALCSHPDCAGTGIGKGCWLTGPD